MAKSIGHFIDQNGNEKAFNWHTEDSMVRTGSGNTDSIVWSTKIAKVDARVNGEVGNFALKLDIIDHIWENNGNDEFLLNISEFLIKILVKLTTLFGHRQCLLHPQKTPTGSDYLLQVQIGKSHSCDLVAVEVWI